VAGDGAARVRLAFEAAGGSVSAGRPDVRFASGAGFPHAADVARIVALRGAGSGLEKAAPPQPFYLRPPDVTMPVEKRR
jgi:tRNA threonylcarbamoyladenosine biosynthesis protein TsaB